MSISTQMTSDNVTQEIEYVVNNFVAETNLEPTIVYVSTSHWYKLLKEFDWMSNTYQSVTGNPQTGLRTISMLTIHGSVKIEVKENLPDDMPVCNPIEYERYMNEKFEQIVLTGEDE